MYKKSFFNAFAVGGKTRLFLLTIFFLLTGTMSIQAAAYYYVKIGGVEITSNNYNNLNSTTIPALKSGTITCDFATRVLTLTNVTLTPGSGKHALELEMDYQIRFYGTNTITTAGASAIRIEDLRFYSVLDVVNGTTTINAGNQGSSWMTMTIAKAWTSKEQARWLSKPTIITLPLRINIKNQI